MTSAKVFMTGRSQAVRLPKAFRFDVGEVLIEPQADGALLLRPKPKLPLGERLRAILQELPDHPAFERPEQPPLKRDAAWWDKHSLSPATKQVKNRREQRTKR